jgi:hypothetical protein
MSTKQPIEATKRTNCSYQDGVGPTAVPYSCWDNVVARSGPTAVPYSCWDNVVARSGPTAVPYRYPDKPPSG